MEQKIKYIVCNSLVVTRFKYQGKNNHLGRSVESRFTWNKSHLFLTLRSKNSKILDKKVTLNQQGAS